MGSLRHLQFVFFLSACAPLQTALGQVAHAGNLGIINGKSIKIKNANYMAGLFNGCRDFTCVGSIVNDSFILTSEDCAERTLMNYHCGFSAMEVDELIYSIDYKRCRGSICLLKLYNPLEFSQFVGKVELPGQNDPIQAGTVVDVTGWGSKSVNRHDYAETLLRAHVVVETCPERNGFFCAGRGAGDIGVGDEGAPVTVGNQQVGIGSLGFIRGPQRYYIRVSQYSQWIQDTIENHY